MRERSRIGVLLLVLGSMTIRLCESSGFLQNELPLKVVVTTPVEIIQAPAQDAVQLSGSQALTVVFSRPIIALGSDFGKSDPYGGQVPFTLNCGFPVPVTFRWVTTTIARMDPVGSWPTDLKCNFELNKQLKTYDGVPLMLSNSTPTARKLTTYPLTMSLSEVTSERASNLTGGLWSASIGATYDDLPEVPPDGVISLSFSYPVNLALLQSKLLIVSNGAGKIGSLMTPPVSFSVSSCSTTSPIIPLFKSKKAASVTPKLDPNLNDTCAQVRPTSSLAVASGYRLTLPKGSVYNKLAGPLEVEASVKVYGLRRFTIPLRQDFYKPENPITSKTIVSDGARYRRLDLWLPHGLSSSIDALASSITLCIVSSPKICKNERFTLTLAKPGLARMEVPSLMPRRQFRLSVKSSKSVLDGFGLQLSNSSDTFWSTDSDAFFNGPGLSSSVALIEMPPGGGTSAATVSWPFIAGASSSSAAENYVTSAAAWAMPISGDSSVARFVSMLSSYSYNSLYVPDVLGYPNSKVQLASYTTGPQELKLHLDPSLASLYIVATCCSYDYQSKKVSSSIQAVAMGSIAASIVMGPSGAIAWVTRASAGSGGPVKGATVWLYASFYPDVQTPVLSGKCTTGSDGTCLMAIPDSNNNKLSNAASMTGVVSQGKDVVVIPDVGYFRPQTPSSSIKGSLVVDSLLVLPGNTVHLSGYLQQESATGILSLPPNGLQVQLQFSSGWNGSDPYNPVYIPVKVNMDSGSFQATVPVPSNTPMGTYTVSIFTAPPEPSAPKQKGRRLLASEATTAGVLSANAGHPLTGEPSTGSKKRGLKQDMMPMTTAGKVVGNGRIAVGGGSIARVVNPRFDPYGQSFNPVASVTLTVADPRQPTADLTLELPRWAKPGTSIPINIQAKSYLGTSVTAANISVSWSTARASGYTTVLTGTSGSASTLVDLGSLPAANATTDGDGLSVSVKWVGPTGELITESGHVGLYASSMGVTLSQTPSTDIPGVTFGVTAGVYSNVDGSTPLGVPVSIRLEPSGDGTATCAATAAGQPRTCNVSSGNGDLAACQWRLPCIGTFNLTACTAKGPDQACTTIVLGRNSTSWAAAPLSAPPSFSIALSNPASSFKLGDNVSIVFQNPRSGASLLLIWGNVLTQLNKSLTKLPAGPVSVPLLLGSECRGGCTVLALLSVPRGTVAPPVKLPTSALFDPLRPMSASASLAINIHQNDVLNVTMAVDAPKDISTGLPVVSPSSNASIALTVRGLGGLLVKNAEVVVIGVDKSVLDLLPYPIKDISADMLVSLQADLSAVDVDGLRLGPAAVAAAFAAAMRRSLLDPWVAPDTTCQAQSYGYYDYSSRPAPVDIPDATYMADYTTALTVMPNSASPCLYGRGCGRPGIYEREPQFSLGSVGKNSMVSDSAPEMQAKTTGSQAKPSATPPSSSADTSSSASPPSNPRMETQFLTTPLFSVIRTSTTGSGSVTFAAPPNLGTFVLRAYAVDGSASTPSGGAMYGAAESQVIVRRSLSLTAALPRFARVGDKFEAGVVVTATALPVGDADVAADVTLVLGEASGPLTLTNPAATKVSVSLSRKSPQKTARYSFKARSIGTASLTFAVLDSEGVVVDSVVLQLEVKGQQSEVTVATSFPLRPNNGSGTTWQEGLALPETVPGSGSLGLIAGVGYLPAVQSLYSSLAKGFSLTNPDGYSSFALSTLPSALAAYDQELTLVQAINSSFAVAQTLGPLNHQTYGLMPYLPTLYNLPVNRADVVLNAWAAWIAGSWPASDLVQPLSTGWTQIQAAASKWLTAASNQLLTDAAASRNSQYAPGPYSDMYTLAWARLALGADWQPAVCKNAWGAWYGSGCVATQQIADDLSLERLVNKSAAWGLEVKVLTALALQASPKYASHPLVGSTLNLVLSSLRVTARTAYVSAAPGSSSAAGLEAQALSMMLLLNAPASKSGSPVLTQKLAAHISQGGQIVTGYFSLSYGASPMAAALVTRALVDYDQAAGSTKPSLKLAAVVGSVAVLEASFSRTSNAPVSTSTPWEELPSPPGTLDFSINGTGEASIAATLEFVPATLLPFPSFRGIWVESSIQIQDPVSGNPKGSSLSTIPSGSLVTITIQLTTPDDLGAVTVEALMPAGLEPMDPNVVGGGVACGMKAVQPYFWWWWWPACPAQETLPDVVKFYYARLPSGSSSIQFNAVAVTTGTFALPPIKASANLQPEVMGMTAAGQLTVVGDGPGNPVVVGGAASPRRNVTACPGNCNDNGVCLLDGGKCACSAGFSGDDCSKVAA